MPEVESFSWNIFAPEEVGGKNILFDPWLKESRGRSSFDESGSAIRTAWVDEVRTEFQHEAFVHRPDTALNAALSRSFPQCDSKALARSGRPYANRSAVARASNPCLTPRR